MTTLTLNIDDGLVAKMRKASKGMDIEKYVEYVLLMQFAESPQVLSATHAKEYRHEALCGIFARDFDPKESRDEYMSEKYGL